MHQQDSRILHLMLLSTLETFKAAKLPVPDRDWEHLTQKPGVFLERPTGLLRSNWNLALASAVENLSLQDSPLEADFSVDKPSEVEPLLATTGDEIFETPVTVTPQQETSKTLL